jgi:hypothetical protein
MDRLPVLQRRVLPRNQLPVLLLRVLLLRVLPRNSLIVPGLLVPLPRSYLVVAAQGHPKNSLRAELPELLAHHPSHRWRY